MSPNLKKGILGSLLPLGLLFGVALVRVPVGVAVRDGLLIACGPLAVLNEDRSIPRSAAIVVCVAFGKLFIINR